MGRIISSDDMNINDNLRRLRLDHGYTQDRLMAKIGSEYGISITRQKYSRYETGELNTPVNLLVALHKLYKCSYDEFFAGLYI